MKCPVCRATYRVTESSEPTKPCHRCGADLAPLIQLHDRAIAHHRQAIAQFTAGDLPSAMVSNDKAIALYSRNPAFHAFSGQLFALAGQFDRAVRSWQFAQKLDPKNTFGSTCLDIIDRLKLINN
jgi:tetratricopeptide (TPR) repeat protein